MIKTTRICRIIGICFFFHQTSVVHSAEWSVLSDVDVRTEYNDNIFLTNLEHESVTALKITPSVSAVVKERNWEGILDASLRSNNYSDHDLDSNDQYFSLTGRYNAERNIYSLNVAHDLDSNLSSFSTDFGIAGRRVERKNQSISPQYTRLITERLSATFAYTYSDVDYLDAENTNFTPYVSETGSASLAYDLTEKDRLNFSFVGVDYASKNDLVTYELFLTRIGIEHEFSRRLYADFLIGGSRRTTTNLNTIEVNFLGDIVQRRIVTESKDRGFVLDAGIKWLLERGSLEGRISRDNTTNSFGGLDQTDKIKVNYDEKLSALWRYKLAARVEDITSITSSFGSADREVLFIEGITYYSLTSNWDLNASYRYVRRKFKSADNDTRAPDSNRIYIGLTYNFPSLSTF